jgi:predicted RNA binding protein YcfA (HicA-like mRNA interferase family)
MTAREVIRALEAAGWRQVRSTGSHRHFRHPEKQGTLTVPDHGSRDLGIGLVRSIERQSGIKLRRDQC